MPVEVSATHRQAASLYALAALKLYAPLFPSDIEPYEAVTSAIRAYEITDDGPVVAPGFNATLGVHRKKIEARLAVLEQTAESLGVTRGVLAGAIEALRAVAACLQEDPEKAEKDALRCYEQAKEVHLDQSYRE